MAATVMTGFLYPKPPGDQPWSVVDIQGSASYDSIINANGGQRVTAAQCGLESIDWAMVMGVGVSTMLRVIVSLAGFNKGSPASGLILQWMTTSGEVPQGSNLSTLRVRLLAIGQ